MIQLLMMGNIIALSNNAGGIEGGISKVERIYGELDWQ